MLNLGYFIFYQCLLIIEINDFLAIKNL